MDEGELELLRTVGTETEVPAGRVLIERGQPGTGFYVLLEGTVSIEAPEGTRTLEAGTVIGERSLVSTDGLRTARARAETDLRLLAVTRTDFELLAVDRPELARRVFEMGA